MTVIIPQSFKKIICKSSNHLALRQISTPSIPKLKTLWEWGNAAKSDSSWKSLFFNSSLKKPSFELSSEPSILSGFECVPISQIAAGYNHIAFILNGELYTYGNNTYGQLGRTSESEYDKTPQKLYFPNLLPQETIKSVFCGGAHTAAITSQGTLYTWGDNGTVLGGTGALGLNVNGIVARPTPVETLKNLGEEITNVACGARHMLILSQSGRLFSVGRGEMGRLGLGSNQDKKQLTEIEYFCTLPASSGSIKSIACGSSHSVALLGSGSVYVWGRNNAGQLGLADSMGDIFSHEPFPRELESSAFNFQNVAYVACGENNTVVLTTNNNIYFFGSRLWLTPMRINIPSEIQASLKNDKLKKVVSGGKEHFFIYGLTESGRLLSWGSRKSGCLARSKDTHHHDKDTLPGLLSRDVFKNKQVLDVECGRFYVVALTDAVP